MCGSHLSVSLSSLLLPPAVPQMRPAALGLAIAAAIEGESGCGRGGEGARVLRRRRAAAEGLIWCVDGLAARAAVARLGRDGDQDDKS